MSTLSNKLGSSTNNGVLSVVCAVLLLLSFLGLNVIDTDYYRRLSGAVAWLFNFPLMLIGIIASLVTIFQVIRKAQPYSRLLLITPFVLIVYLYFFYR